MNESVGKTRPRFGWDHLLMGLGLLVLLALIIKACGADPAYALRVMLVDSVGSKVAWGETLSRALVLGLSGLAVAVSFRAGLFNIGAEGQFLMGASLAGALAVKVLPPGTPTIVGVPLMLLAGMFAGGVWSLLAGAIKRWRGVSEVIVTLMLNLIAALFLKYLVNYPELLQGSGTNFQQSAPFPPGASFSTWGGTSFHAGVFLIIPAALALYVLIHRTRAGLSLRATGLNPYAAQACGIPVGRVELSVFALSGALAGLGGAAVVMATGFLPTESPYNDYGYMAIAVALVANLHPLAVVPSALAFAMLETGSKGMERLAGVPSEVVYLIEGIVILVLLSRGVTLPGSKTVIDGASELKAVEN